MTGIGTSSAGRVPSPAIRSTGEVSTNITANLLDTIHWNAHRLMSACSTSRCR